MCDIIQDKEYPVIEAMSTCSKEEVISQSPNEEENKKDSAPEILGKSDACSTVPSQLLQKLAHGFLSFYIDDIRKASCSLQELTKNQNIVIETLQQENARFSEVLKVHQLADVFSKIKYYNAKVQVLKKDLFAVHERTAKLKKRAMRLQQQKQKEALQKELIRDREIERDKQLAPKIATKALS